MIGKRFRPLPFIFANNNYTLSSYSFPTTYSTLCRKNSSHDFRFPFAPSSLACLLQDSRNGQRLQLFLIASFTQAISSLVPSIFIMTPLPLFLSFPQSKKVLTYSIFVLKHEITLLFRIFCFISSNTSILFRNLLSVNSLK